MGETSAGSLSKGLFSGIAARPRLWRRRRRRREERLRRRRRRGGGGGPRKSRRRAREGAAAASHIHRARATAGGEPPGVLGLGRDPARAPGAGREPMRAGGLPTGKGAEGRAGEESREGAREGAREGGGGSGGRCVRGPAGQARPRRCARAPGRGRGGAARGAGAGRARARAGGWRLPAAAHLSAAPGPPDRPLEEPGGRDRQGEV